MKTCILLLSATAAFVAQQAAAQVPNGGFEDWTTVDTYQDPTYWTTVNSLTALGVDPPCQQISPGAVGAHCVKVSSRLVAGLGVYPGILISGDPNAVHPGFPISGHPEALVGQWQYNVHADDMSTVSVLLTKWDPVSNNSGAVAVGSAQITGALSNWQTFNVALTYVNGDTPDTAIITVQSSAGSGSSETYIMLDDLHIGDATGIAEMDAVPSLKAYPSPAIDVLHVAADIPFAEITVADITGRPVFTRSANVSHIDLDVADLPAGRYFLQVRMPDGTRVVRSFVKN